jgi:serine phosphatase RsbU (regulator of sigma subunit)
MLEEGQPSQLIPKVVRINNKELKKQKIQVSQSIISTVVEKHSAVLISDTQSDTRFRAQESILKLNIQSAMCVPLWNNKEIIGIIYADKTSLLNPFSGEDLRLLTLLSNLAAVKIENAKLFEKSLEKEKMEKELALASQIQKDLLPSENPEVKNFDIAGANVSCYQVGGDYYDFVHVDSDRLGIAIADVSGKGVSSSLLMASLRAALHSEIHPEYDLEMVSSKLNNFVHRSSSPNSFITFFYCELNHITRDLRYINAGHNPPIHLTKGGKVNRLESCGLCLGMFPNINYKIDTITLAPGDILLLYTDGFTESRDKQNNEFQEQGLIDLLSKHTKLNARELLDTFFAGVKSFTKSMDQMDDMTLIVIKCTG